MALLVYRHENGTIQSVDAATTVLTDWHDGSGNFLLSINGNYTARLYATQADVYTAIAEINALINNVDLTSF